MFIENLFLFITLLYIIFSLIGLYGRCSLYETAYEDIDLISGLKDRLSGFSNYIKQKKDMISTLDNKRVQLGLSTAPPVLLEGFEPKYNEKDDFTSPSYDILNDRYNRSKRQFTDEQLYSTIINKSTLLGDDDEYDHNDTMVNDALHGRNDADKLIFEKNKAIQNHYKLSDAIEKNKSKASYIESFKTEFRNNHSEWWGGYGLDKY